MDGKLVARIVAGLVLIAAVAGIAFLAFNAGVAQGSPVTIQAPSGGTTPMPYPYYGYGYPLHRPFGFGWGFGILGLLLPLFILFVALRALRFLFWAPRRGWRHGMHMHGPWGMGDMGEAPPVFNEWHKRAHSEMNEGKQE
jgi:hypothetical protein